MFRKRSLLNYLYVQVLFLHYPKYNYISIPVMGVVFIRRIVVIALGFFCMFTVLMLGNRINITSKQVKNDNQMIIKNIYHTHDQLKQQQLSKNPNYNNLGIIIDIDSKQLYLINNNDNELLKLYTIATGKPSTPSPLGSYKIVQKAKWGGGFGSRWLKLNVPWGRYGIHGTNKPSSIGYNASHGCIRMRNKDIEELFKLVKYNTPVNIVRGHFGPFGHGFRILKPGDRGADVQEVQKRLKMKGYYHSSIDGIYGEHMKSALIKFLKENNMTVTDKIGYSIYKKLDIVLMD